MVLNQILKKYTQPALADYFTDHKIVLPTCLADPESKLMMQFQATCYTQNIPGTQGTIYNLAWTVECFTLLETDCLVIDASIVSSFRAYLKNKNKTLLIPHLIVIGSDISATDNEFLRYTDHHQLFLS